MCFSPLSKIALVTLLFSFAGCVSWPLEPHYDKTVLEANMTIIPLEKEVFWIQTPAEEYPKKTNSIVLLDQDKAVVIGVPTTPEDIKIMTRFLEMKHNIKEIQVLMLKNDISFLDNLVENPQSKMNYLIPGPIDDKKPRFKNVMFSAFDDEINLTFGKKDLTASVISESPENHFAICYLPKLKLILSGNTTANIGEGLESVPNITYQTLLNSLRVMESDFKKANSIIPNSGTIAGREVIAYTKALINEKK